MRRRRRDLTVRFLTPNEDVRVNTVNGAPGLGVFDGDRLTCVVSFIMNGDRISRVDAIRARLSCANSSRQTLP